MIDSTPIVVIAGQVGASFLGTDAFQEVDLVGITQPISKWSYQIRRAEDVAWAVARAFYIAEKVLRKNLDDEILYKESDIERMLLANYREAFRKKDT